MCQGPADRDVLTELAEGKLVAPAAALDQRVPEDSSGKATAGDDVSGEPDNGTTADGKSEGILIQV